MSGSGGGGGGGDSPTIDNCASFTRRTTLNSPEPKVLKTLAVDDELTVGLDNGRVVVATDQGKVAGVLTFAGIAAFKKCLEAGYTYSATVVDLQLGNCEVEIRYAP